MISQTSLTMDTSVKDIVDTPSYNILSDKWILWAHLPQNKDWSLNSYIPIHTFDTLESVIAVTECLPSQFVESCMLFVMKSGITPTWEDKKNRNGGCFSYKVSNKNVLKTWAKLTYRLTGGTISTNAIFAKNVTGITISPKKNFCIVKIWTSNCDNQNPAVISHVDGLISQGCIFKKHVPEY